MEHQENMMTICVLTYFREREREKKVVSVSLTSYQMTLKIRARRIGFSHAWVHFIVEAASCSPRVQGDTVINGC